MKAALLIKNGGPDALKIDEIQDPIPRGNEVLVNLKFAALNHLDIWIRKGIPAYRVKFPHILGADGAGVVEKVGPDAEGVSEGDRVVLIPAITSGQDKLGRQGLDNQSKDFEILGTKRYGTYAQKIVIPDLNIVPLPDEISFETAAAFPLAYLTAFHMLVGRAQLKEKETVVIVGASAGVSTAAIQIAKWKNARVLAITTKKEKASKILKSGADKVHVLKEGENFANWVLEETHMEGAQVVFEHVGPATWDASLRSLAPYGRLVTCGATTGPKVDLDLRYVFSRDLSILGAKMGTQKEFQQLSQLVFDGKIKPLIDKIFPLSQAADAQEHLEKAGQVGKILLKTN